MHIDGFNDGDLDDLSGWSNLLYEVRIVRGFPMPLAWRGCRSRTLRVTGFATGDFKIAL